MSLPSTLETDYLVVGAGASAMSFVDTLLSESPATRVVMVDKQARPGGHWLTSYSFVRLHQPSALYGVSSRALGAGSRDALGLDAGAYSLATGPEIVQYFDDVMQQRFLPSGRVTYLPMSSYAERDGAHHVTSHVTGEVLRVQPRKLVDARLGQPATPATHPPSYAIAPGVTCVPINALASLARSYARYTIVGAGKTAIDACVWLLGRGLDPERIRWIMPRDPWLMDRANFQPGPENFERYIGSTIRQFEAIAEATSMSDLLARLERAGQLVRIGTDVTPTAYRCGIVSQGELAQLRRIRDIVRHGRVRALEPGRIVLERGEVTSEPDTLYVDCSSCGLGFGASSATEPRLVFDGDRINVQLVRWCQPMFSAAVIAYVEAHVADPATRNAMCGVVPPPNGPASWLSMWASTIANMRRWGRDPGMAAWLATCRLNPLNAVIPTGIDLPPDRQAMLKTMMLRAGAAVSKMKSLLAGPA